MVYDIAVRGHLSPSVAAAFDDFELIVDGDTTTLRGEIVDRAALHGVINRIEQFGLRARRPPRRTGEATGHAPVSGEPHVAGAVASSRCRDSPATTGT